MPRRLLSEEKRFILYTAWRWTFQEQKDKCTHVTVTSNGEGGSAAGFRPAGEVAEKETGGGKDWASLWKVFSSNQKNEANLPNCWKIYKTL